MDNKKNVRFSGMGIYMIIVIIAAMFIMYVARMNTGTSNYTYNELVNDISKGKIESVSIRQNAEVPTGVVTVKVSGEQSVKSVYVSDVKDVEELLLDKNIEYTLKDVARQSVMLTTILPFGLSLLVIVFIMMMFTRQAGGGGNAKMMNFGKSRARMISSADNKVTFKDVAGEASVPFFSISGSDFVEMFVGVGASRVRDMFEEAKKNAPCIIFIDEIDAVARRRGTGMGGGHDEREQTLNQMLVEMDGFGVNEGIIVMAATNRIDILDPAILRPGRFDRKIVVGRPDVAGRLEILKVHAAKKPLGDDVDLDKLARTSAGFTGADLENVLNEAAINAARKKNRYITNADVEEAFIKIGIGVEKKSKIISDKEKKITAYHESGHAILFHLLPDVGPVHTISIIPTGMGAAGYTMPLPERDEMFNTKGKMLQNIVVSLGGRVAEELIFDDITTGASQDIKQATQTARDMVTKYGFSDKLGLINYDTDSDEVFIGRDLAHTRPYGEDIASLIDEEVKRIVDECYAKAKKLISENMDVLHRSSELLLEKEKISREEFESLFEDKPYGESL